MGASGTYLSRFPRINSENHLRAISGGTIFGGILKAKADILKSGPEIPLSIATFMALMTSIMVPAHAGPSTVLNRMSMVNGALPKYLPLIQK